MSVMRHNRTKRRKANTIGRAQSAMEYLMTYGWAILLMSIVLIALFESGIFNSNNFVQKALSGSCFISRPNGPGSTIDISASGICTGLLPQSVAQFNGQSSKVAVNEINEYSITGSMTEAAWVNFQNDGSSINLGIVAPGNTNTFPLLFLQGGPQVFSWAIFSGVTEYSSSSSVKPKINEWYFVVGTYNQATGVMNIYLNGSVIPTGAVSLSPGSLQSQYGGGFSFGTLPSQGTFSQVEISNVQIYNTSLPSNNIKALYQEGIGGAPINIHNLVGWWPLNGNANDYSGNNNNGTATAIQYITNWQGGYTMP